MLLPFDVLGMTAPQAAGVIHSDFEKGFIRAETVSLSNQTIYLILLPLVVTLRIIIFCFCYHQVAYNDFVTAGSLSAAREKGLVS